MGSGGMGFVVGAILAAALPGLASAAPERHIPHGEEHPHFIEIVFSSPVGEVQFTQVGNGHSGFLRNSKGNLMGLSETRGSAACETWVNSNKSQPLPQNCEFSFYDSYDGRALRVRSEEMKETDLFQTARGKLRGFETSASGADGGSTHVSL